MQDFHGLKSDAPSMVRLFKLVERAASAESNVLVRGESGSGKELVARALHDLSRRKEGPFMALNCASFRGELLASELFGHVKGAFTGAIRDKPGILRLANGGTVFLDELAEIPLEIQAQLLRVVQEQVFVPVGGTAPVKVDVRFISATHRSLRHEVEEGRFRADLMYRLRVVPIFIPPLRHRHGDIPKLCRHFLDELSGRTGRRVREISDAARSALHKYPWPGNVRELRNALECAMVLGEGDSLELGDLPPELRGEGPPVEAPLGRSREAERILDALEKHGGHRGKAAEEMGMSRSTLWRKLREYGLN